MKHSEYLSIVAAVYSAQALSQEAAFFLGLAMFGLTCVFMWKGE